MTKSVEERFWPRINRALPSQCWEWTGSRNAQGYGAIVVAGKSRKAHRVAYMLSVGPIPEGLVVMHSCDNPPCCNPAHLSVGTMRDNAIDAFRKGRVAPPNGLHWNRTKTHCPRNHEYTVENTHVWKGKRACRACRREHDRARRAARSAPLAVA